MRVEAITVDELEGRSGYSSVWGLAPFVFGAAAAILSFAFTGLGGFLYNLAYGISWLDGPAGLLQRLGSMGAYVLVYAFFFIAALTAFSSASRNGAGLEGRGAGLLWAPFAIALVVAGGLVLAAIPLLRNGGSISSFHLGPEMFADPWLLSYSLAMNVVWVFSATVAVQGFVVLGLLHAGKHPVKAILAALGFDLLATLPSAITSVVNAMQYSYYGGSDFGLLQVGAGALEAILSSLALSILTVLTRSLNVTVAVALVAAVAVAILRYGFVY